MRRSKLELEYEKRQASICGVSVLTYRKLKLFNRKFSAQTLLTFKKCTELLGVCRVTARVILDSFAAQGLKIYTTSYDKQGHLYVDEYQFMNFLQKYKNEVKEKRDQILIDQINYRREKNKESANA